MRSTFCETTSANNMYVEYEYEYEEEEWLDYEPRPPQHIRPVKRDVNQNCIQPLLRRRTLRATGHRRRK